MKTAQTTLAFVGGGPMTLMLVLEYLRQMPDFDHCHASHIVIVSKEPEAKLGYGDVLDSVHEEVLFNVPAERMSLNPDPEQALELVRYLQTSPPHQKLRDHVRRYNHAESVNHCFVPRVLLQPIARRLASQLRSTIAERGMNYEFIHGEVTNIEDTVAAAGERRAKRSTIKLEIHQKSGDNAGALLERSAHIVVLAFGSPKKTLPGEDAVKSAVGYCDNLNCPPPNHILHPDTRPQQLPPNGDVVVAGSKLSAVDALLVLQSRGILDAPGRKAIVVSPTGRFPYPHEAIPSNTQEYQSHSLLRDPDMPSALVQPQTAQQLADSIVLTCLYAAGVVYNGENWLLPSQTEAANLKVLTRLARKLDEVMERLNETDRQFMRSKFGATRPNHTWQVAFDVDFRPRMESIWKRFPGEEKKKWVGTLDHERLYNDLRHRVPAKVHDLLLTLQEQGKVQVKPGGISDLRQKSDGTIQVFANGNDDLDNPFLECQQLIKATGWEHHNPIDQVPLLRYMRRNGMVHKDNETDMGIGQWPCLGCFSSLRRVWFWCYAPIVAVRS